MWTFVRDSLWFVPTICTIVAALAALLVIVAEQRGLLVAPASLVLLGARSPESARSLLSAVAGGLITVTGVSFSVTILALELSSSQFTPRVIPNFMANRATQIVLGVLIGTFTYCLVVLRVIGSDSGQTPAFVPRIAITGGMLLALASVGAIIFFINHAAQSIQVSSILQQVTEKALSQVGRLFPEDFGENAGEPSADAEPPPDHMRIVASRSGYLQAIDDADIFKAGGSAEAVIAIELPIGAFVLEGEVLARAWPPGALDERARAKIARAMTIGDERTREQDYELALIEISDVAVKALSPSINDPTTAMHCIDRLSQLLLALARRHAPTRRRTRDGRLHVIVRDLPFDRAVHTAFAQIVHFGESNPAIRRRITERLETLLELVPPQRRPPLAKLLDLCSRGASDPVPGR